MCEWIMGVFLILQELFLQGKDERGGVEEKGNDTRLEKKVPSKKKKKKPKANPCSYSSFMRSCSKKSEKKETHNLILPM